jgi:hypothetical protein
VNTGALYKLAVLFAKYLYDYKINNAKSMQHSGKEQKKSKRGSMGVKLLGDLYIDERVIFKCISNRVWV